jgi:hypothetical protein
MAVKTLVTIESDISGNTPAEIVQFGWDGYLYEVDLTSDEKQDFADSFEDLIKVARTKGKKANGKPRPARSNVEASPATVREWARSQGIDVPKRGRIPSEVFDKFAAAEKGEDVEVESTSRKDESPKAARKKSDSSTKKNNAERPVASEAQFSAAE